MSQHLFTPADDDFIFANRSHMTHGEIAQHLGLSTNQIRNRIQTVRRHGRGYQGRQFTDKEDAYIINNRSMMSCAKMGEFIGASEEQVAKRIIKLRDAGVEIDEYYGFDLHANTIRDGYDYVPYHMRQSTRNQYQEPLAHDKTG